MRASKESIDRLKSLTFDKDNFPRMNSEQVPITVGDLRAIINILEFMEKEPCRSKPLAFILDNY